MSKSSATKQQESILINFRKAFTIVVIFNLIFLIERSIFDFMGFMFGMIIADLLFLIFLIIGLFGAYQYRVNYVATSTIFALIWIGWNIFIICVYLNVGLLDRYDPFVLNLNTDKKSWWFTQSIGCKQQISNEFEQLKYADQINEIKMLIEASTNANSNELSNQRTINSNASIDTFQSYNDSTHQTAALLALSTTTVPNEYNKFNLKHQQKNYTYLNNLVQQNCILPFYYIEIIQASVLIFLAIFCVIFGLLLANSFNEEDDTFDYIGGFDTVQIIPSTDSQPSLPRTGQIRLEPVYAFGPNKFSNYG